MRKIAWSISGLLLAISCLLLWLTVAMDYSDSVAAGSYHLEQGPENSTLVLNVDHTFQQTLETGGVTKRSNGTWRRVGEGGVSFSKEFLVVSGDEPEPDGTTFSDIHKAFGMFPSLVLRQYHVLWYMRSEPGNSLAGTYAGDEPGIMSTLILNADHSFNQKIAIGANEHHAVGTWKQGVDGAVQFSNSFLKTSGEALQPDETASAMDPQGSNLQIEISKATGIPVAVFRKRLI